MQLQRIRIGAFRNLREIEIDFDRYLPATAANLDSPPQPIRGHALIGQNGTGKSNLIEALITIFRDVDLDREDRCPFLLDEPDTHLNPVWKLRYFDDIEQVLTPREDALVQGEPQILITTHDPMMVGSLKREQVHILRRDGKRIRIDMPDEHPQSTSPSTTASARTSRWATRRPMSCIEPQEEAGR